MDKGFAEIFYFGYKKVVFTSITPTPSSSIRNLFNCIHTPPISLLDLLIPAAGIFRRAAKT